MIQRKGSPSLGTLVRGIRLSWGLLRPLFSHPLNLEKGRFDEITQDLDMTVRAPVSREDPGITIGRYKLVGIHG